MILGQLLERSDATVVRLDRIEKRLSKVEKAPRHTTVETVGAVEKMVKSWLTWLLPLGVAWVTGSLETAAKLAGLLR
jgi:hypothetical protein